MKKIGDIRLENSLYLFSISALNNKEFAAKINVSPSYWGQIKNGKKIGDQVAQRLEGAFSKQRGWLDHERTTGDSETIYTIETIKDDTVLFKIMGAELCMGLGITQDQVTHDEQIGSFETTKKWVNTRLSSATSIENVRIITALGDSMRGTFNHGDALFVDTGVNEVKVDAIYALAYDDELFIKRVQRIPGGRFKLISDNKEKEYAPILIDHKDVKKFQIIGRVVGSLNYNETY